MTSVPAIVVPAVANASVTQVSTFIFLHGLGDTGHGWLPVAQNWRLRRRFQECAFIFPHAPSIPITLNYGMRMPGWFDITSLKDISSREDEEGMTKSIEAVHRIIEEQIEKGVKSEKIVVGGFSQGGAIALLSGLSCKHQLGGIVALSTWLPMRNKIQSMIPEGKAKTPIFQAHGQADETVKFEWGQLSRDFLKERLGQEVDWHQYPDLGHSALPEEINDLEAWLEKHNLLNDADSRNQL
ncbi:phospholipase/carboxylesterase [Ascodesmis nigricans]|uniref:Acyl-protein thioesterase 1 n=1 Tax=Ascodesmis nigricans TaxID=341454 RepID=A0A4S2MZU2_9PEZI|nr:phospholipase/carboxylesterase [Ascodesmis nigricans]